MLFVAYDFATLCDVSGRGAYSSEPRKGRARSARPDPSACEFTEIGRLQVGKMLKLLIALGLLTQVQEAGMNQPAVYAATIPKNGNAEYQRCLAVAAELGFKPRVKRDTTRATQERRRRKADAQGRRPISDVDQAVDDPVDAPNRDVVPTTSLGRRADDVPQRRADDVSGSRADDVPLPIGVLGNRGAISNHLGTGPWAVTFSAEKQDPPDHGKGGGRPTITMPVATVDGQPSRNRWGTAITQKGIRKTGRALLHEALATIDRCQGLDGRGCAYHRPVSPSNDKGLCIHCYGQIAVPDGISPPPLDVSDGPPLSFNVPEMPPPNYGTADGDRS